jgi:hypothetical protein
MTRDGADDLDFASRSDVALQKLVDKYFAEVVEQDKAAEASFYAQRTKSEVR